MLSSCREKGVAAREGGGVWVSLLLFGREKEERFPVVAVAAAVTQRRTTGEQRRVTDWRAAALRSGRVR